MASASSRLLAGVPSEAEARTCAWTAWRGSELLPLSEEVPTGCETSSAEACQRRGLSWMHCFVWKPSICQHARVSWLCNWMCGGLHVLSSVM